MLSGTSTDSRKLSCSRATALEQEKTSGQSLCQKAYFPAYDSNSYSQAISVFIISSAPSATPGNKTFIKMEKIIMTTSCRAGEGGKMILLNLCSKEYRAVFYYIFFNLSFLFKPCIQ